MSKSKRNWLILSGCVLSALAVAFILWRLDWAVFVAELARVRYGWLALGMFAVGLGTALRALRWALASDTRGAFPAFWSSAVAGLAFNNIYPLRAGEVLRMFLVSRLASIPFGRAATSAVIDRVADMLVLGGCAFVVAAAHTGLPHAEKLAAAALAVGLALLAGLILFAKGDRVWRGFLGRYAARLPARLLERIQGLYASAIETSRLAASPLRLLQLIALTAVAFAMDFSVVACVVKAFGWELSWLAAVTVVVFVAIGTSLPSAPAYAGVYQVACVLALALFGIDESSAVAFSVLYQICVIAAVFLLAVFVLLAHRDALRAARVAALARE